MCRDTYSRYIDSLRALRPGDGIPARGEIYTNRPHRSWGAPSFLYTVLFPVVKVLGRGVNQPLPSKAEVEERVQLLPICAFVAGYMVNFTVVPKSSLFECSLKCCEFNHKASSE